MCNDENLRETCARACLFQLGFEIDCDRLQPLPIEVWTLYKDKSVGCTVFARYDVTSDEELELHTVLPIVSTRVVHYIVSVRVVSDFMTTWNVHTFSRRQFGKNCVPL